MDQLRQEVNSLFMGQVTEDSQIAEQTGSRNGEDTGKPVSRGPLNGVQPSVEVSQRVSRRRLQVIGAIEDGRMVPEHGSAEEIVLPEDAGPAHGVELRVNDNSLRYAGLAAVIV